MNANDTARDLTPAGVPLQVLFERDNLAAFPLPAALAASYGGSFGLPRAAVYANFVSSLDGIVALPGATESGQIISGKSSADRFVMGLLRAAADAVLIGAGTFRKSKGHRWLPERIYPAASAAYAELRSRLGLSKPPRLVLLSASGTFDTAEPALESAWIFTTPVGASRLQGALPSGARLFVREPSELSPSRVVHALRSEGVQRILTEGGPSLFAELVQQGVVDDLFLTSSPALFGRFPDDERKSLADGFDLNGARSTLASVRRHGSHLFLHYQREATR